MSLPFWYIRFKTHRLTKQRTIVLLLSAFTCCFRFVFFPFAVCFAPMKIFFLYLSDFLQFNIFFFRNCTIFFQISHNKQHFNCFLYHRNERIPLSTDAAAFNPIDSGLNVIKIELHKRCGLISNSKNKEWRRLLMVIQQEMKETIKNTLLRLENKKQVE